MRNFLLLLSTTALFCACTGEQPRETPGGTTPAKAFNFVSEPATQELMADKVEKLFNALWAANLEENSPKKDADWKPFEDAAQGLLDAGKAMMLPPFAKDEGKWKEETQKFISLAEAALKAVKERNLKALNDTTNNMTEATCTSCHKLYYNGQ